VTAGAPPPYTRAPNLPITPAPVAGPRRGPRSDSPSPRGSWSAD